MDALTFLQRVLPSDGKYVSIVINGEQIRQRFHATVAELAKTTLLLDSQGNNIYFAISSFGAKRNRKQDNVHKTKVLALDVDCVPDGKKPFATQQEGLAALGAFVARTGLPRPMIVSSGRGLHIYWVLSEALVPEQWLPIASALKAATAAHGFEVDVGLTANHSLVLRVPGTHNPKNNAEVRVLMEGPEHDPAHLLSLLIASLPSANQGTQATTTAAPPPTSGISARGQSILNALAVKPDFAPANSEHVATKCAQIAWAVKNPDKVPEPFWYSLIGVASACEAPEETAKAWSAGHPNYSEADTLKKLAQWKRQTTGPATCAKFKELRPKGCAGCPVAGKITSPTALGAVYAEAPLTATAPDANANEVPLPRGFKRTAGGIAQTSDGTDVLICDFDIYPTGYGFDESKGYETVRFKWNRRHVGWCDLIFRQAYLAAENREFPTALADQGIVLDGTMKTGVFQMMLRAYMNNLRELRTVTNYYNSMGWKENHTRFIVGDRLYRRGVSGQVEREDISLSSAARRLSSLLYSVKGDINQWHNVLAAVERAGLDVHMFSILQAFASPLWSMTGLKGVTLSLFGPTGSGKTIAQLLQQSVWGDPGALHFAAKFTQNTLFNRLGLYCNLPMTIDECTLVPEKDVSEFCYWVTQGRDKARLTRSAEERDARTWETVVTISTNLSWNAKLMNTGMDTDAQMARLVEVPIPVRSMFAVSSDVGRKIAAFLMDNHGLSGDVYARYLVSLGKETLRARVSAHMDKFSLKYNMPFNGTERYWQTLFVLSDLGGELATEAGAIRFDYTKAIAGVLGNMDAMRRQVSDNKVSGVDLLGVFMMEHRDKVLTAMTTDGKTMVDQYQVPRGEIVARVDLYRKSMIEPWDHGTIMLSKTKFRKWLASRGHDYSMFTKEMRALGADATPASKKVSFGRGTGLRGMGQTSVLGLNLAIAELNHYLEKYNDTDDLTLGQMAVVQGANA